MKSKSLMLVVLVLLVVLAAAAHGQYSVLYNFGSKAGDPSNPSYSGIIAQGRDGNMYSTATGGGGANAFGGAVFKITPTGTLTVLHSFTGGTDGFSPQGGLTLGTDGNFYGTTSDYSSGCGTVFKITPGSPPSLTTLYTFKCSDGEWPFAPPIQATDGNFYGTTIAGGIANAGTIYKITSLGAFTPLCQFDVTHGANPYGPLVQGTDGNFYGMTNAGGTLGFGVVFKCAAGKLTTLHNFQGGSADGAEPFQGLVQGTDGNFYGATQSGGIAGVVFEITPSGTFTDLHNINGTSDGAFPDADLAQATDGNFYGVTPGAGTHNGGTIFRFVPPPKDVYAVLYNFNSTTGSAARVTLLQHTNGLLYGDTQIGGTGNVSPCTKGNCGVFYSFKPSPSLPAFVSLLPYSGKVGQTTPIEFLGQGFTSSSTVFFNGTKSPTVTVPTQYHGTYLTATVPNGATTGFVTVTTSGGTLKSNKIFRVIPQITSFSPTSGPVGTSVIIKGISLKQTTKVTFGGVPAPSFTVNSDTQVTATVPSGAKTGKITVTTPGGTATSSGIFTVT
jgi:uncharacterized repeat protein (TIGR03803 family)